MHASGPLKAASRLSGWVLLVVALMLGGCRIPGHSANAGRYVLVLHGGAGVIDRKELTAEREAAFRQAMSEALLAGEGILRTNGTSLDAVAATIRVLEDSPLFNAGRGAVLNRDGAAEMDASIMEGSGRRAGAVAGVHNARNPIDVARAVMERTPHVLLTGPGADSFVVQQGLKMEPAAYFITEARLQQWERLRRQDQARPPTPLESRPPPRSDRRSGPEYLGTVGAVALDRRGNLAAGTSTGGLAYKLPGRVGDSPLIGAGTYADNATCAVSATGHGEYFIRAAVAHDIAALMDYRKLPLAKAADLVIKRKLVDFGGEGGVIAVDRHGNIAMPFNTVGMYRAYVREDGQMWTGIHRNK